MYVLDCDSRPIQKERFQFSLYLITVILIILSFVSTYMDKRVFDVFITFDLIFGILQIASLTLFVLYGESAYDNRVLMIFNLIIWMINNIFSFFTYKNSQNFDFLGLCVFFRIGRIFSACICMISQARWINLGIKRNNALIK